MHLTAQSIRRSVGRPLDANSDGAVLFSPLSFLSADSVCAHFIGLVEREREVDALWFWFAQIDSF